MLFVSAVPSLILTPFRLLGFETDSTVHPWPASNPEARIKGVLPTLAFFLGWNSRRSFCLGLLSGGAADTIGSRPSAPAEGHGLGGGSAPSASARWCIAQPRPELDPEAVARPDGVASRCRWVRAWSFSPVCVLRLRVGWVARSVGMAGPPRAHNAGF